MNLKAQYEKAKAEIDRLNWGRDDLQSTKNYLNQLAECIEMLLFGIDEDIKRAEKENDEQNSLD